MSKISIEVETNPKTLKVMIDGEEIEGISNIWINRFFDFDNEERIECSISTVERDSENKVEKRVTFSTAETKEVKKALGSKTEIRDDRFPGFIGYRTTVHDDISAFLT